MVHLDYLFALFAIRLCCGVFHILDSLLLRDDIRNREECRLKDCVYALAKADFLAKLYTVDGV